MTYNSYELSPHSGSPFELYRFAYIDQTYLYSTLDGDQAPIIFNGEEYQKESIGRSSTDKVPDMSKSFLDLKVPRTFPVAKLFMYGPPESVVTITVFRLHLTDPDLGYITFFKGRVMSCNFSEDEAELHCEPIFTSLKRPGLRMVYDTACVHAHYSSVGCTLLKKNWKRAGAVLDAQGTALIVQEASLHPDGWFSGGQFICGDIQRLIMIHAGVHLTLLHPVPSSVINKDCVIYPGCDHSRQTCGNKFDNAVNFGGFSWMPLKNPYTGDNIFW